MCLVCEIIYNNRNSMGNTLQNQQNNTNINQHSSGNICGMSNQHQNSVRCSIGENLAENMNGVKPNDILKVRQSRAHKSLDSKGKQKLSLSKQPQTQTSTRLNLKRSASNDCRGIGLTQVEKTVSQYRPCLVINRSAPKFNIPQTDVNINKTPIRPRDLPRRISTQKIIVFPQSTIKRVPLEPRIIINPPASSPCIINYVKNSDALANSRHSLQSSIVTPFVPPTAPCNQYFQASHQPRKLKKVAMNRSHTNYNTCERGQNNGQDSEPNKQNEKTPVAQQLAQSGVNQDSNGQQVFTDPKLYAYITSKQHPFAKQIKSKFALPTSDDKYQQKRSNHFINLNSLTSNTHSKIKVPLLLQQVIPDEVQSKPLIEGDMNRFPTLSEFSEDGKTDNTSFIPIRNNSSKKDYLEGEQLLKYCRPKIDQIVLADLQKLPLKH